MISRAFSSMPGLASGIARDIRDGTIKKYLIQPIDMLGFLLLYRMAHKLVYYARGGRCRLPWCSISAAAIFPAGPTRRRWRPSSPSLVMAFLLGFFLEATLGMIGFWFLEVSSLLFVYMLFNFFFSGHMFPIDMLPGIWGHGRQADPAAIPGLFPRGRVPGQGHRGGTVAAALGSSSPGSCFSWSPAAWRSTSARGTTADTEDEAR